MNIIRNSVLLIEYPVASRESSRVLTSFATISGGNEMKKDNFSVNHLTKKYPGVLALDDVSLSFEPGTVHALVGENGAGKSTLIKCLAGAISPTSGSVSVGEKNYNALTPQLAGELGIAVIYQEFNQVLSMSAAENVFLGVKTEKGILINKAEREKQAREFFLQLQVDIDPAVQIRALSPACQQIIEIAKAIRQQAKLLIMDEPTAPLTIKEVKVLFQIVHKLKNEGVAIVYISHRIEEIFEIADVISVLRDGKLITTQKVSQITRPELIQFIVGREITSVYPRHEKPTGKESLRVEHLTGNGLKDISFTAYQSEILGFAGLVGAGRTELMEMLYGAVPKQEGHIYKYGQEIQVMSPKQGIETGIGLIPEDRKLLGLFLNRNIQWNCSINAIKKMCCWGVINSSAEQENARKYEKELQIKTPSLLQIARNLSGGNQQKVVLAKTLAADTDILIFDEPTRGVDVGGKQEIYHLINKLADDGKTVLVVSSDLPELMGISDRIAVIYEGYLAGIVERANFEQTLLLDLASGGKDLTRK